MEPIDAKSPRPNAETMVPRLLDAVEMLCVEKAPSGVTMRMIAAEAGLSVGAAYRYFDSRDALFGATLDRMVERIMAAASADDSMVTVPALWEAVSDNPAFAPLVTSFVVSGRYASDVMAEDPMLQNVMQASAHLGMDDPQTVAAVTGVMVFAGTMFAPTLSRATGRDPGDRRVLDALAEMLDLWLSHHQADGSVQLHTGVDPEELTDEELAKVQDELGIKKQVVTDQDKDA